MSFAVRANMGVVMRGASPVHQRQSTVARVSMPPRPSGLLRLSTPAEPLKLRVEQKSASTRSNGKMRLAPVQANSESLKWEMEGQGLDSKNDYSGVLAVLGFAAHHFYSKFHVSSDLFLQSVAVLQLVVAFVSVIMRRADFDRVAVVVGPAVLATAVLSMQQVSYMQMATGLYGYFLSEHLEGPTTIPFWVWGALLLAGLYGGYGTECYVAGWGVLAAARIFQGLKDNVVPLFNIPILISCGYALSKDQTLPLTLLFFLGQVVWSGVRVIDVLTTKAS